MASDKVSAGEEIRRLLREMHPDDRNRAIGVFSRLENDHWRDVNKIDFGEMDDEQLWGIVHDMVNVTFIEEDDGRISIVALSSRSRFRPTY